MNDALLGRMFAIYTRKKPENKGFNPLDGKPVTAPRYGYNSLNSHIRKKEIESINDRN